jgi:hypothetical protein
MSTRRDDLRQELLSAEGVRPRGPDGAAEATLRRFDIAYLAWFEAESECGQALRNWCDRGPTDRDAATDITYCAALDREEAAARDLERLCKSAQA